MSRNNVIALTAIVVGFIAGMVMTFIAPIDKLSVASAIPIGLMSWGMTTWKP